MIKKLSTALSADENIPYLNEDASNVIYSSKKMDIFSIYLKKINLFNNFDDDDPDTILIRKVSNHWNVYNKIES